MIYKVEKLTQNSYRLNETITIIINENSEQEFLKADYDEKSLTEKEVDDIIDVFMQMMARTINVADSVKVEDANAK